MTSALTLTDVHKSFGAAQIIRGVNLAVEPGERHAIIGPNGAGKSTLFNLISGRYLPSRGEISLHGEKISDLPPYKVNRKGLSRSFQITNLFHNMTVFENLRCSLLWAQGYKYSFWHLIGRQTGLTEATEQWLERLGLEKRRDVQASLLTYAEQRTLEIGTTIAGGADVVLLDEPTAGMGLSERDHAMRLIREVTRDKTLLIVEHDMSVVFELADRISVLVYGEVIASDTPDAVRGNAAVQEAYLGEAH
ncbi:ABC transporter ATP-binding protein [Salinisphaera aquimarina]|uniref:ABC transporter ATP-binding protein n=1 Tax=Salinisphaera aquimarina TaxID=2094031 RepID=A0ABV7EW95_9GAMM